MKNSILCFGGSITVATAGRFSAISIPWVIQMLRLFLRGEGSGGSWKTSTNVQCVLPEMLEVPSQARRILHWVSEVQRWVRIKNTRCSGIHEINKILQLQWGGQTYSNSLDHQWIQHQWFSRSQSTGSRCRQKVYYPPPSDHEGEENPPKISFPDSLNCQGDRWEKSSQRLGD